MKRNDALISLGIPKELLAKLNRMAVREKRSRADMIRVLLDRAIK
jgi:metal-responsive CopG/Arc/MetJ family transcriptional regulator